MEHQRKFNLEQAIDHYIEEVNQLHILEQSDADEIRDHFHSTLEALSDDHLEPMEKFTIAKMRFGETKKIEQAFLESNSKLLFWKYFINAMCIYAGCRIAILGSYFLSFLFVNGNLTGGDIGFRLVLQFSTTFFVIALCFHIFRKTFNASSKSRFKTTLPLFLLMLMLEFSKAGFVPYTFGVLHGQAMSFSDLLFWLGSDSGLMAFFVALVLFAASIVARRRINALSIT